MLNPATFTGWVDGYVARGPPVSQVPSAALYAEGAVVRDTMAGLRLEGATAIGAAASGPTSGGALPAAVLHTIPEDGGPAAYATGDPSVDRRVLLVTVDDGGGCPGEMAVALWLNDDERIVREERYHRVDAMRRCSDPDALPEGWWDAVTVPGPPRIRRTGFWREVQLTGTARTARTRPGSCGTGPPTWSGCWPGRSSGSPTQRFPCRSRAT